MPDFPLHPTLFISLAILVGFAISPLLAYVDNKSPIENNTSNANNLLNATWWLAAAFGISLLVIYNTKEATEAKEMVMALAPLGMMIAAMIASASVMKNIAETKSNEVKKHEKEDSKFYLEKCVAYLKEVDELLGKLQNDKFSWAQASITLTSMREISQKNYITEPSHQKIFEIEYTNSRIRLFRSMMNLSEDRKTNTIKPAFFCSVSAWQRKDLATAFSENGIKIDPKHIITVMKFIQVESNSFLEETNDYSTWRTYDLDQLGMPIPMKFIIDYIKMYKEKIPANKKENA